MKKVDYIVSAIVSVYNSERFIRDCLEDLENQTIRDNLEIVIINSGSEENEGVIVKEYQDKYENIIYIETKDRETIYAAWNRGINASSGKYITNANTDDRHHPDAFRKMASTMEENSDIDLVYADYIITEEENQTFENHQAAGYKKSYAYDPFLLLLECYIGPQPMWRRKLHQRFGYFDETFEIVGDYEFWLRLSEECTFKHIKEYLGLYLQNPQGRELKDDELAIIERERVREIYIDRFMPSISGNKDLMRKIRKKQSESYYYLGYGYFSRLLLDKARAAFRKSLAYSLREYRTYRLLLYSYFPVYMVWILRRIKHRIKH